jgi:hypothetical protein
MSMACYEHFIIASVFSPVIQKLVIIFSHLATLFLSDGSDVAILLRHSLTWCQYNYKQCNMSNISMSSAAICVATWQQQTVMGEGQMEF